MSPPRITFDHDTRVWIAEAAARMGVSCAMRMNSGSALEPQELKAITAADGSLWELNVTIKRFDVPFTARPGDSGAPGRLGRPIADDYECDA